MTGRQQNSLTLILFSPREPRFHRRCAPLKVSLWRRMSAVATGIFILTGDNALLLTTFALAFSPVDPFSVAAFAALRVSFPGACPGKDGFFILTKRQIKTGDNALLLTAFALAFSPVSPLSVAAFAALRVSFPGACPGKDDIFSI